jgi:hypothetical protein
MNQFEGLTLEERIAQWFELHVKFLKRRYADPRKDHVNQGYEYGFYAGYEFAARWELRSLREKNRKLEILIDNLKRNSTPTKPKLVK